MTSGFPEVPPDSVPILVVPEIRDYRRINEEIVALLNLGHSQIRLEGVEGQRLVASGLAGSWQATIEVEGRIGPEFGANLDAPGLRIIAVGDTLDGAGSGLRSGTILINGHAGSGLGYAQSGGLLVVGGDAGDRAGLTQSGGTVAVLGSVGRLAGDRQEGGFFFLGSGRTGPHASRGQRGGHLVAWSVPLGPEESLAWQAVAAAAGPWFPRAAFHRG